ncbi:MAG: glycoside hydrolase family 25 protein [Lachnospiraceae bacterium]|nr:glycoside hydrolase family 25 protein [Lachnospiraceae bacterium]
MVRAMENYIGKNEDPGKLPKRKGRNRLRVYIRIVTAIDVLLLLICAMLLLRAATVQKQYQEEKERADELAEELAEDEAEIEEAENAMEMVKIPPESERVSSVRTLAERGAAAIELLKALFPHQVVIADEGSFYFYDIDRSLKPNGYDSSKFSVSDNGTLAYEEDGRLIGYRGIDVSQHNGEIDWEKVREDGVEFVFIRAGIRGYGSGKLVEDERFEENYEGAKAAGLNVGVYFFTQALTEKEGVEEAEYLLELIRGRELDLPVALDVEKVEPDGETIPRTQGLSKEQYTKNVKAFCERIGQEGMETIIYGNGKTFAMLLDISELEDYDKWFADYISEKDITPYFPYHFRVWQYDSTWNCSGVNGNCDVNLAFY